jgi:hypothetical protein
MSATYERPSFREIGSVRDLTQQGPFNKVGTAQDAFTMITNGVIIGSLVTPGG